MLPSGFYFTCTEFLSSILSVKVGDTIGLAISAASSYESGTRYPSYDALVKLARIFHVSIDYLLGVTDVRNIDVTGLNDSEIECHPFCLLSYFCIFDILFYM